MTATSVYHKLSKDNSIEITPDQLIFTEAELHNIELFSANEETDLPSHIVEAEPADQTFDPTTAEADPSSEIQLSQNDDILYEDSSEDTLPDDQLTPEEHDILYTPSDSNEPTASILNETDIAEVEDNPQATQVTENSTDNTELKIVDASQAPVFTIPLRHNFEVAGKGKISVSDQAESNQIAMASQNVTVDNLGIEENAAVDALVEPILPSTDSNPWEVAEVANKNISKNSLAKIVPNQPEPAKAANETQVAYKMQKNILIPIPDEIMNDKNLTPQISSSSENKKLEEELRRGKVLPQVQNTSGQTDSSIKNVQPQNNSLDQKKEDQKSLQEETISDEESQTLTESIAQWFSSGSKKNSANTQTDSPSSSNASPGNKSDQNLFQRLLGLGSSESNSDHVAPTELKLSFQPNRAEISGQTLEWLHAFADNAVKYDNVIIEIRMNRDTSYDLQQKRLKLLHTILQNNGVDENKIKVIFTDREPNSFIIRNVRYATPEEKAAAEKKNTYSPWY